MKRVLFVLIVGALALSACEEKKEAPEPAPPVETVEAEPAEPEPKEEPAKEEPAEEAMEGMQWVAHDTYGVKFRVPDDWEVKQDGENVSVTSPDSAISVLMVGTESEGLLQTAIESIKKEVTFKDVELKKDSQTVLNGLPGYTAQGSAVLEKEGGDQEIEFIMNSVRTGEKGIAMMVFAEAEMYEAKKEEVQGIAKTLQKK